MSSIPDLLLNYDGDWGTPRNRESKSNAVSKRLRERSQRFSSGSGSPCDSADNPIVSSSCRNGRKELGSTMQNTTSVTRPRVISTTEKSSFYNLPTRLQYCSVSKSYDERSVDNSRGSILGDRETLDSVIKRPRSTEPITPSDQYVNA